MHEVTFNSLIVKLASSVVDRGFYPRRGQTKDYEIGIWCFSTKHAVLNLIVSGSE